MDLILNYTKILFLNSEEIFQKLEKEIEYLPAEQSTLRINGKVCKIPRQLAAYGDPGLSVRPENV